MPILSDYLDDIDEIKEDIKKSSEFLLKNIPDKFFDWPREERKIYLRNLLYDLCELQNENLEKAKKLGRKKAKA